MVEFYDYVGALLERRAHDPGDDLISKLLAAEIEGDRLSDTELVNLVLNVLIGGVDTSQSQLTHAVRLFAGHPDQWQLLAEDPSLAAAAADEALRFEPITPVHRPNRRGGGRVPRRHVPGGHHRDGLGVHANRDPVRVDEPDRFDISADRGRTKPLTFGAGIHYCLGANLARAELQEALAYLPRAMPGLKLDGEPEYDSINGIYGLERLPVSWG